MSEVAPWRALEDGAPSSGDESKGTASGPSATTMGIARSSWMFAGFAAAALVAGAAIWLVATSGHGTVVVEGDGRAPESSDRAGVVDGSTSSSGGAHVVVDVQGAVVRPGIVELPAGARVADAITAAGGYGPRVAADRVGQALNLAALLKDGDQVVVPSRDDPVVAAASGATGSSGGGGGAGGGGAGGPLDLNRATLAELDALPGIGPVTAAKIIAARDEQAFASVDDLRTRKILGAATFDKVKDLVVVR